MTGLVGERFGRLTVVERLDSTERGHSMWLCRCDCGAEKSVLGTSLRKGATKSCGCLSKEITAQSHTTHGKSATRTFAIWRGMKTRCQNKNSISFKNYGGRGITVCERWMTFENFLADMGECPAGFSIDRIDPNGNYEPRNCQWVSHKTQQNNRRNNHLITLNGETKTLTEWCEAMKLSENTVRLRLAKGWPAERALSPDDFRCAKGARS